MDCVTAAYTSATGVTAACMSVHPRRVARASTVGTLHVCVCVHGGVRGLKGDLNWGTLTKTCITDIIVMTRKDMKPYIVRPPSIQNAHLAMNDK